MYIKVGKHIQVYQTNAASGLQQYMSDGLSICFCRGDSLLKCPSFAEPCNRELLLPSSCSGRCWKPGQRKPKLFILCGPEHSPGWKDFQILGPGLEILADCWRWWRLHTSGLERICLLSREVEAQEVVCQSPGPICSSCELHGTVLLPIQSVLIMSLLASGPMW